MSDDSVKHAQLQPVDLSPRCICPAGESWSTCPVCGDSQYRVAAAAAPPALTPDQEALLDLIRDSQARLVHRAFLEHELRERARFEAEMDAEHDEWGDDDE